MIRWAPFWPMPGTRGQGLEVVGRHGAAQLVGREARPASPGPAWGRPRLRSAPARRSASRRRRAKPNRVSESSRTTMLVGRVACAPMRSVASVAGVHMQLEADAADLEHGAVEGHGGDLAADERDHCFLPAWASAGSEGGVDAGLGAAAPDVADGQRQRVGGVGRLGRCVEPQHPGHHGADLGLVGPAAAGDGGLDLARRVQRDRHARAGRPRPARCRWPGRCP